MCDTPGRGSDGGQACGSWGSPDVVMGGCFTPRHRRDPQKCPGRDAAATRPGQALSVLLGGWMWLFCKWILSVVMLEGRDTCCLHQSFAKRLLKVVLVAVALEAAGCAGDTGSTGCRGVTACPGAVPVPSPCRAGTPARVGGMRGTCQRQGRGRSDPRHPHQVLLIHRLSCTSQASFNVACLSCFELLFGIKQNNQRFVMFPALKRITKLKKQLKYLWLALFCVQCAGVNAK